MSDTPFADFRLWVPIAGAVGRFNCIELRDQGPGVEVRLRPEWNEAAVLKLLFESPIGYRNIDESYRLRTWHRAEWTQVQRPWKGSLLTSESSDWIRWLREESGGVLRRVALVHYAVLTDDDCIDVVTEFEPSAEWL